MHSQQNFNVNVNQIRNRMSLDKSNCENDYLECKGGKIKSKVSTSSISNYDVVRGNNIRQFGKDLSNNNGYINNNFGVSKDVIVVKSFNDKNAINRKGSINSKNSKKSRNSYKTKNVNINSNVVNINTNQVSILL